MEIKTFWFSPKIFVILLISFCNSLFESDTVATFFNMDAGVGSFLLIFFVGVTIFFGFVTI